MKILISNDDGYRARGIVALAGMSVIWPLGDALPPTAIIGRLTKDTVGMREPYGRMLVYCIVPAVLIILVGTLMVLPAFTLLAGILFLVASQFYERDLARVEKVSLKFES